MQFPDKHTVKKGKKKKRGHPSEDETYPKKSSERDVTVITERPDDIPFLIGAMMRMGMHEIIDRHVPRHPLQRELSWGLTALIWLAYVLSEGDHRKVSAEAYIKGMRHTLENLAGCEICEADFTDDRLTNLLRYLSDRETWENIENDLNRKSVSVYELPAEVVRCDATTVSGHHEVTEDGMFQFGHSKDDPDLPQIKMMTAAPDPLGMPPATDIVSGEKADDPMYVPVIKRISQCLGKRGLLYAGDCKMCAADTRRYIVIDEIGGHYLCPLPKTGNASEDIARWAAGGVIKEKEGSLEEVTVRNEKGEDTVIAKGYVLIRSREKVFGGDDEEGERKERIFVVKSPTHAKQMEKGLEKRLKNAGDKLFALTPQRGRGKRQITGEAEVKEKAEGILKKHRVTGLISYEYEKEVESRTKYIGRGRGSAKRKKEVSERVRYQITAAVRDGKKIEKEKEKYGWRAYVTDLPEKKLSLSDAVRCYRKEYRVERIFNRLKSRLNISPLYVKRNDQIRGMTCLLTLGVRVLTLTEFVVRRSLRNDNAVFGGDASRESQKEDRQADGGTTSESLLRYHSDYYKDKGRQSEASSYPLSEVQKEILKRAGLNPSLYQDLEINKSPPQLTEW
ncbi:IS1634 family transposase [Desulfococcaceae bacterium HSG8]|nr:IS1634 family transposase [Desulfococcaceae bacterium HSG8]